MDKPTTSKRLLSYSEDDIDRSTTGHSTGFDESSFGADDSFLNTRTPSSTDKDTFKLTPQPRPAPGKMSSQKKSATDLFPWLKDVEKSAQKCLGSIPEAKTKTILNAMDFLIRKMVEDCQKYCKSPRLSITLARYIREFLYTYRYLYKGFEMGIEFFRRVTKLLVIYTDLELCGSMSGQECDNEIANRIQLTYCTHLEGAEDFTVLDVFINMKRLSRIHRGVLSLLLKHFLVKITVKEPVEVEDDTFAKYLIVFKKWLAIEDIHEDKEDIRSAFITQVKPKKMFCMNSKYAPYLPAGDGQKTTDNYVRMLDKKFSLQPLLRALELTDKNFGEPSTIEITKKLNDVVVLSDDEENDASEIQLVNVKTECGETSDNSSVIDETSKPELIDLTEEAYEETNAPRLYISWLADLIERAKIKPTTMDQRLEGAHISSDIIVIDDPEESNETNKKPSDESQTTKITSENVSSIATSTTTTSISTSVTQTDSSSTDSGRVLSNREEVGIHWKNNFEMCPTSVNVECINETQADENQLCQPAQAGHGNVVANQLHLSNDDNSSECNAFNVSSSDGNKSMIPINMNIVASGSISSCSDEAAEQLLTVALKNQKLNDRLPTSMDLIDKVQQTSDVDCTVESTSLLFEPTSSDCLPQPSQMPEPSTATVYRRLQVVNDKNLGINFDLKADELAQNDELIAAESVNDAMDEYNAKMLRSQAKKCITVVHPTRHNQSPINAVCKSESTADYPQDMTSASSSTSSTSSSQKHFECSIPLSSIKTNNLFTKTVDNRSSPQSYERTIRSTQNVITAELSIDNNVQATANTSSFARRRVVDKPEIVNDNENVPSTIMERKTYIKKPSNKTTSTENRATRPHHRTRSPTLTIESRQTSQSILPQQKQQAISQHSTSDQHQQQQQQQQQLQQQLQQQHQQHISPSKTTQTQHQPYKLFYSGTDLGLDLNDIGSPLSECASPSIQNPLQSLTSAFCESDNNLIHNTNVTMKLNGPTASLPSAIVHPLGLEQHVSKHSTKVNIKQIPEKASFIDKFSCGMNAPAAALISSDERSSIDDQIDSCDNFTTMSSNSDGELDIKYKPEYMLQIYKELGNHLKTMGFKPENEMKTKTRTKRLMNAASRFLEAEDINASNYSPEPNDENDEGNASSLPLKKRRIMSMFNNTIIKEEESDSQRSFESPSSMPSMQCEIEIASTSLPSPPIIVPAMATATVTTTATATATTTTNVSTSVGTNMNLNEESTPIAHMECVSYPPTPMLSIANIVEYLPVRAYSTFKTPAPEIAPVRFNILPQQAMVINNTPTPNVMGATNTGGTTTGSGRAPSNQHVEFETTFNLIPSQQNLSANQTNSLNATAPPSVVSNGNISCGIVASDGELMTNLGPIPSDVAQYHHQTFHSNSPYAATYSIQPTHTNPNSLPPNFEIQNMFNLHNYQMNPQHYHNLLQNSRINFQEKKSILLNDYGNSVNDGGQEISTQSNHQHQHQHQQYRQHQHQHHQSQTHQNIMPTPIDTKASINKSTMAPRTKAARKMVAESVTVAAISSSNDKLSASKTNRVTRSSNRTTRAQNVSTEQKSPRRKTNRHR